MCNIIAHRCSDACKTWHMETVNVKTAGGQTQEQPEHISHDQMKPNEWLSL